MSLLSALLDSKLEDAKLITHMQSSTISCTSCALTRTLIWGVEVGGDCAKEQPPTPGSPAQGWSSRRSPAWGLWEARRPLPWRPRRGIRSLHRCTGRAPGVLAPPLTTHPEGRGPWDGQRGHRQLPRGPMRGPLPQDITGPRPQGQSATNTKPALLARGQCCGLGEGSRNAP